MNWFRKKKSKMTKEQKENLLKLKNIESFCNIYHGAIKKYGDDGHDQFVELLERKDE